MRQRFNVTGNLKKFCKILETKQAHSCDGAFPFDRAAGAK
jgi:hypothetical protein